MLVLALVAAMFVSAISGLLIRPPMPWYAHNIQMDIDTIVKEKIRILVAQDSLDAFYGLLFRSLIKKQITLEHEKNTESLFSAAHEINFTGKLELFAILNEQNLDNAKDTLKWAWCFLCWKIVSCFSNV